MDCWDILGISPDADIGAIKRAYAMKLKRSRPEDDAEAFNELRRAYEQALEQTQVAQATNDSVAKNDIETRAQELSSRFAASEIEALVSEVIDRLKDAHQTTQALAWLSNHDLFVDLNSRPILEQALLQRLSSKLVAGLPALVELGLLFSWLDRTNEAESICVDFFYCPSAYEALIAHTWMDTEGARITGAFFELAKQDLEKAAEALEGEIERLDQPFKSLVARCFARSISELGAVAGNQQVDARTLLTIANFFGWQGTQNSPLAIRRARLQYEISCLPTNLSKRAFSPRQRALWRLRYKKGSWRDFFIPTYEHFHLACAIEECKRTGLDPHSFANTDQVQLAQKYDPQKKLRWRLALAALGLLIFLVFAGWICLFVLSSWPIAGIGLTFGVIQLLTGMYRDYSSIEAPPSVR